MSVNYHPSDTTEIVKSEFVFEQSPEYDHRNRDRVLSALNRGGKPSGPLPEAFKRNRIELSDDAHVWTKSRNRWLITDGAQNFLIKKGQDIFKVYKRPTIENCSLEYSYFLEIDPPNNIDKIDFPRYIQPPDPSFIAQLRERQTQQLVQLAKQGINLYCVDATVDWRLIVGLGSEHVQETNMTLHHIYGIPYIPGSAVKGVLRHWWLQVLKEDQNFLLQNPSFIINSNDEIDESIALKDPVFLSIFGSQEKRGKVRFLDAYPEEVNFATDIMNPHYPDYYSGSKPPTDHQNPIPINFLTVKETTFRFTFLAKDQKTLDKLKNRFQEALEMKGIGAKTGVGYGYFRNFINQTNVITDELNRQQQAVEEEREAKRIESLSPIEQLAEELNRLSEKPVDEERAVKIYSGELPLLDGDEEQMIAQSLKDYWQRINKWDGGSDKQRKKVMKIKLILGER